MNQIDTRTMIHNPECIIKEAALKPREGNRTGRIYIARSYLTSLPLPRPSWVLIVVNWN